MKTWSTIIYARHNITGQFTKFVGPNVKAPTRQLATEWCEKNCGYLHVDDELVAEVDENGTITDYENTELN